MQAKRLFYFDDYPLQVKQQEVPVSGMTTRAAEKGRPIEIGKSNLTQYPCVSDAIIIWNLAPATVTNAKSLYLGKKTLGIMLNQCQLKNRVKTQRAKAQGQKIKVIRKVNIKLTHKHGGTLVCHLLHTGRTQVQIPARDNFIRINIKT